MKNKIFNLQVLIILVVFVISSCASTENVSTDFLSMLNNPDTGLANKLRFDGAYQKLEAKDYNQAIEYKNGNPTRFIDTPYLVNPIFFFSDGLVLYSEGTSPDSTSFNSWLSKYGQQKWSANRWGVFEIKHDTINAEIYTEYFDGTIKRLQLKISHFEGTIKNKDTLSQWHMIPPYPKISLADGLNQQIFEYLKSPRDLYFKSVPTKALIDSSKAWINKFRSKKKLS